MSKYLFYVKTGDCYGAGTDSDIFVTLKGELGQSREYRLNKCISGNAFEKGNTDKFELTISENVGKVYEISVRSDCRWLGSDWYVEWIKIVETTEWSSSKIDWEKYINDSKNYSIFQLNRWFENKSPQCFYADNYYCDIQPDSNEIVQEKLISLCSGEEKTIHISMEEKKGIDLKSLKVFNRITHNQIDLPFEKIVKNLKNVLHRELVQLNISQNTYEFNPEYDDTCSEGCVQFFKAVFKQRVSSNTLTMGCIYEYMEYEELQKPQLIKLSTKEVVEELKKRT